MKTRWCLDRTLALTLYAGFAACGDGAPELTPCNPSPEPLVGAPQITSFEPAGGPAGTTITVRGTNFLQIDERFEAAYGDFSITCDHGTMDGTVVSDTEIELIIPEQAKLPGYVYLLMDGLTVTKSPRPFDLEASASVTVTNHAQFPIVSVSASWEPVLEEGTRIDVDETVTLDVPTGPLHLELCVGDRTTSGEVEPWACVQHDDRLDAAQNVEVTVPPLPAALFLVGEWVATWEISEEETAEERLSIDENGYWEISFGGRIVEHGELVEPEAWRPYTREFGFKLRPGDRTSETSVPVRVFALESRNAGGRVDFYRPE